jgi:hypothetical protein
MAVGRPGHLGRFAAPVVATATIRILVFFVSFVPFVLIHCLVLLCSLFIRLNNGVATLTREDRVVFISLAIDGETGKLGPGAWALDPVTLKEKATGLVIRGWRPAVGPAASRSKTASGRCHLASGLAIRGEQKKPRISVVTRGRGWQPGYSWPGKQKSHRMSTPAAGNN